MSPTQSDILFFGSLSGYVDRRRNNDNDSTTYQTEESTGESSETSWTDQNRERRPVMIMSIL